MVMDNIGGCGRCIYEF